MARRLFAYVFMIIPAHESVEPLRGRFVFRILSGLHRRRFKRPQSKKRACDPSAAWNTHPRIDVPDLMCRCSAFRRLSNPVWKVGSRLAERSSNGESARAPQCRPSPSPCTRSRHSDPIHPRTDHNMTTSISISITQGCWRRGRVRARADGWEEIWDPLSLR